MHWQPIETAPKDGTLFDLWVTQTRPTGKHAKRVTDCRYSQADRAWVTAPPSAQFVVGMPTHWQPLPAPPAHPPADDTGEQVIGQGEKA